MSESRYYDTDSARDDVSFTTSYGDEGQRPDWDGLSCADFSGVPGRTIRDVESLTMLNGMDDTDPSEL